MDQRTTGYFLENLSIIFIVNSVCLYTTLVTSHTDTPWFLDVFQKVDHRTKGQKKDFQRAGVSEKVDQSTGYFLENLSLTCKLGLTQTHTKSGAITMTKIICIANCVAMQLSWGNFFTLARYLRIV